MGQTKELLTGSHILPITSRSQLKYFSVYIKFKFNMHICIWC